MMNKATEEKLTQALEIYLQKKLSSYPCDEELEKNIIFSPKFERKMEKLIKCQKKPDYKMINTTRKRVAAVIVLFVAILSVSMSVEAVRKPVIDFFLRVYEKFSYVDLVPEEGASITELEEVEDVILPAYVPEGFTLTTQDNMGFNVLYDYTNAGGEYIICTQSVLSVDTTMTIDTEGTTTEKIEINDYAGIYYENKGVKNIIWNNGVYMFSLSSKIKKEELLKIAKSIN